MLLWWADFAVYSIAVGPLSFTREYWFGSAIRSQATMHFWKESPSPDPGTIDRAKTIIMTMNEI